MCWQAKFRIFGRFLTRWKIYQSDVEIDENKAKLIVEWRKKWNKNEEKKEEEETNKNAQVTPPFAAGWKYLPPPHTPIELRTIVLSSPAIDSTTEKVLSV